MTINPNPYSFLSDAERLLDGLIKQLQSDMNKDENDWQTANTTVISLLSDLQTQQTQLNEYLIRLEATQQDLQTANHSLTRQITQLTQQITALEQANKEQLTQLATAKANYNTAKTESETVLTNWQTAEAGYKQKIQSLEATIHSKEQEILTLQNAFLKLEQDITHWATTAKQVQSDAEWLSSQLQPLERRL